MGNVNAVVNPAEDLKTQHSLNLGSFEFKQEYNVFLSFFAQRKIKYRYILHHLRKYVTTGKNIHLLVIKS